MCLSPDRYKEKDKMTDFMYIFIAVTYDAGKDKKIIPIFCHTKEKINNGEKYI